MVPQSKVLKKGEQEEGGFDCSLSGTTATMAFVKKNVLWLVCGEFRFCCILLELAVLPVQSSGYVANVGDSTGILAKKTGNTQERHMAGSRSPDFIDCLMKMRGALMWYNPTPPIRKDPVSAEVFMPRTKSMSS